MIKKIYAIMDKKMSQYSAAFIAMNDADMRRGLDRQMGNPQSQLFEYPEDFDIYFLGEIDLITGKINAPVNPEWVISVAGAFKEMMMRVKAREPQNVASMGNSTDDTHKYIAELERKVKEMLELAVEKKEENFSGNPED